MFIKKISIAILILLTIFVSGYSEASNVYLDYDNYCRGYETTFTVWNETQWENRSNLEEGDRDYFEGVEYIVYDGPLSSIGVLKQGTTNNISEFSVEFSEQNNYLIEIRGMPGNFTEYEERTEIEECRYANNDLEPTVEYDIEEILNNGRLNISIKNTTMPREDIIISIIENYDNSIIDENEKAGEPIDIYQFEFPEDGEFSAFDLKVNSNQEEVSIYSFDEISREWNPINKEVETPHTFSIQEQGVYGVFNKNTNSTSQEEEMEEESIVNTTNNGNNSSTNSSVNEVPVINESQNNTLIVIVGALILLGLVLSPFFLKSGKKKEKNNEEVLSTYKQEYEKTRQYVLTYKNSYQKEAIKKALLQSNMPRDIIDKVMEEVYP